VDFLSTAHAALVIRKYFALLASKIQAMNTYDEFAQSMLIDIYDQLRRLRWTDGTATDTKHV